MTVLWLFWQILIQYCKFLMPRPLRWGIPDPSTIILSKDIDKYAFMCGSNFYESDVRNNMSLLASVGTLNMPPAKDGRDDMNLESLTNILCSLLRSLIVQTFSWPSSVLTTA